MRRVRVRGKGRRARSDLVSLVCHQFGTPLTVILGFSELILNEPLSPEEIREYAADIHKEATRLSHMISQMRDRDRRRQ